MNLTIKILLGIIFIFLCNGCEVKPNNSDNASKLLNNSTDVPVKTINLSKSFNLNLTSFKQDLENAARANNLYVGDLTITNLVTSEVQIIVWHANLNTQTFKFDSTTTLSLKPGTYKLRFVLSKGDSQYIGEKDNVVVEDNQVLDLDFNLSPLIGNNLNINIETNGTLNMHKIILNYDNDDFKSLEKPNIKFILDTGREIALNINKDNGDSDTIFYLRRGEHNVTLKLFDDNKQVGKSSKTININANENIIMDIKPLKGDLTFSLSSSGIVNYGQNLLKLTIDKELLTLTQSVDNTKSVLKIRNIANNNLEEIKEFQIIDNNGSYSAVIYLSRLDININISINIEFFNKITDIKVGEINIDNVDLSVQNNQLLSYKLILYSQSNILTGNVLASLTMNVKKNYVAVKSASIFIDDIFIGLTESENNRTIGSLRTFIKKGNHTILVKISNIVVARRNIVVKALDVLNMNIDINGSIGNSSVPFKIKVKIDDSDKSFKIGVNPHYNYNYSVDCNDNGELEVENRSSEYTCNYNNSGEYVVSINGTFPHFYSGDKQTEIDKINKTNKKIIQIEQWGDISWKSMDNSFAYSSIDKINNPTPPNLSNVIEINSMFSYATSFDGNISDWNVSSVKYMYGMFFYATSFNGDLSKWDTSSVIYMNNMFDEATSFNSDISDWNTSSVLYINNIFYEATSFNSDISDWNTSSVLHMSRMFYKATSFNSDISDWNTSSVLHMTEMFYEATSFNSNLSDWNTSSVIDMNAMFNKASSFNSNISDWDTSSVTNMNYMFFKASTFNQDLTKWNVNKVTTSIDFNTDSPLIKIPNFKQ